MKKSNNATAKLGDQSDVLAKLRAAFAASSTTSAPLAHNREHGDQPSMEALMEEKAHITAREKIRPKFKLRRKGKKKITFTRSAAEAARQEEKAAGTNPSIDQCTATISASEPPSVSDQIKALIRSTVPHIEVRAFDMAPAAREMIKRRILNGAVHLIDNPACDENDGYIVGIDFGTSALKLAVRQPYRAGDPVVAMPAPAELRSGGEPYLWQTVIWYCPATSRFSLMPDKDMVAIDGFKSGLLAGHDRESCLAGTDITCRQAAIAFLALHFAHMLGWYNEERPLGSYGGNHFLAINIGIPVESSDDKNLSTEFIRIVEAALRLARDPTALTKDRVVETYNATTGELPPGITLVPELAAAIAGYLFDVTAKKGSHFLVDVGASTLDMVAFNVTGLADDASVAVFEAKLDLLGASVLELCRSAEIGDDQFSAECQQLFYKVFRPVCSWRRATNCFDPTVRKEAVQLLVTGGGRKTTVHDRFVKGLVTERLLGTSAVYEPSPPPHIALNGDMSRLLLAFGLTRDVLEIPSLKRPSEIENVGDKIVPAIPFIDKDMV